jgi:COMPASS component SWD3
MQLQCTLDEWHEAGISDIDWNSDSSNLISASDDKTIGMWDMRQVESLSCFFIIISCTVQKIPANKYKGHSSYVMSVKFSPSNNTFISGNIFFCRTDSHI